MPPFELEADIILSSDVVAHRRFSPVETNLVFSSTPAASQRHSVVSFRDGDSEDSDYQSLGTVGPPHLGSENTSSRQRRKTLPGSPVAKQWQWKAMGTSRYALFDEIVEESAQASPSVVRESSTDAQRTEVLSEVHFKLQAFLLSCWYEMWPTTLSRFMCAVAEGWNVARSRDLTGFPLLDLLHPYRLQGCLHVHLVIYLLFKDDLPVTTIYENVLPITFIAARALLIGIKYAFYSDRLLLDRSVDGLGTAAYDQAKTMERSLMSTFVYNANGLQPDELIRLLYKSCVFADVDLSQAMFHLDSYNAKGGRRAVLLTAHAERICKHTCHLLQFTGCSGAPILSHAARHGINTTMPTARTLPTPRSIESRSEEALRLNNPNVSPLLHALLRESPNAIFDHTAKGQLPASVLAVYLIQQHLAIRPWPGRLQMVSTMVLCGAIACAPLIIRAHAGYGPVGEGFGQNLYYVTLIFPTYTAFFVTVFYSMGACLWTFRLLRLSKSLLRLIDTAPSRTTWKWTAQHEDEQLPVIDLRKVANVEAWAVLWRVVHGASFAPSIRSRIEVYHLILTLAFFVSALAPAVGGLGDVLSDAESAEDWSAVATFATNLMQLVTLSVPLALNAFGAYSINVYSGDQARALYRALTTNRTLQKTVERTAEAETTVNLREMRRAADMLEALAMEVQSTMETAPMRLMMLPADPATMGLFASAIGTVLFIQLYGWDYFIS